MHCMGQLAVGEILSITKPTSFCTHTVRTYVRTYNTSSEFHHTGILYVRMTRTLHTYVCQKYVCTYVRRAAMCSQ